MRLIRRALKALAWLLGGLAFIVAAWALSNSPLADAAPKPRPAALVELPMTVPEARNAWFALADLAHGGMPGGADWFCARDSGCDLAWLDRAHAYRLEIDKHRAFGTRCETIASAADFAFEEPPFPQPMPDGDPVEAIPMRSLSALQACVQWLRVQASLALAARDDQRALAMLGHADRLVRAIAERGRTLVVHVTGWTSLRRNWQLFDAVASSRPDLAPQLLALLRPLDPAAMSARRWIASESTYGLATIRNIKTRCARAPAGDWEPSRIADWLWCNAGIGLLPNQTAQDSDRFWEAFMVNTDQGLTTVLSRGAPRDETSSLSWRNTLGRGALDLGAAQFSKYAARQANADLHRLVVELGLSMRIERMSAAQRAAWLQAQNLDPALRSRITLTDDALDAKPWLGDQHESHVSRDRIHVSLTGA